MQVLMSGWEYPPNISGGLGVACYAIVQALIRKNISVNLVLPYELVDDTTSAKPLTQKNLYIFDLDKTSVTEENQKAICTFKIDSLLHPYLSPTDYQAILDIKNQSTKEILEDFQQHYSKHHDRTQLSGLYGQDLFAEVLRYAHIAGNLAKNIEHQVIHAHDWMTILAGIKAKHLGDKKLIFHVHALEIDRSDANNVNKQIFDIEKYGMEQADKIVAVSNYTKDLIVQHYGIPEEKIVAVHNGIDTSYAQKNNHKNHKRKMVLFVGRITHQKGPYFFVAIAKKILEKRKDVEFVIAGTGNLLYEMIERVAEARIGNHVHFTGFLNSENLKEIYTLASVYVMPSVSEPFGLSCLEALAYNVPVVLTKQSGAAEALPSALQADFWDTDEMASKILALLDYRALGRESLHNVKNEMQPLTWDKTGSKLVNLYESLL